VVVFAREHELNGAIKITQDGLDLLFGLVVERRNL
jgi:hypothetical protein